MRKALVFKMLLRTPVKTLLTFVLIAAASFSLFSRVTDYVIMSRETADAESFYHGVAALDTTLPTMRYEEGNTVVGITPEDKPWPEKEKIDEFSSLPGVTVADQRYMTAGQAENYKRLIDPEFSYYDFNMGRFVLEGTYEGYQDGVGIIELLLDDVSVLAGEVAQKTGELLRIQARSWEDEEYGEMLRRGFANGQLPLSFFRTLDKGSRCLVMGTYDDVDGSSLVMEVSDKDHTDQKAFYVLDGLGTDYMETEEFAYPRGMIRAIQQDLYTYDIVYTADMRAIPRMNEQGMAVDEGRPLIVGDEGACVVSELFLEANHLSVGDRIKIRFGDQLRSQNPVSGALARYGDRISNFVSSAELEIVGAYHFTDDYPTRITEKNWTYTQNTIFVPVSLLPVAVSDDYVPSTGEYSVFVEDARDIEAFREAAESLAAEMGVGLRFSDGGWMSVKDSFGRGRQAALLAAGLYVLGAALALFLAVYLYIARNKKTYAIMRMLGVPGSRAKSAVALPFAVLAFVAVPVGGAAGLLYTSQTAAKSLAGMAGSAPEGYVPDTGLPLGASALCLIGELLFLVTVSLLFLEKMRKTPPLELLWEGAAKPAAGKGDASLCETSPSQRTWAADIENLVLTDERENLKGGRYGAFRHVGSYVLRHMRRSWGKTAVSLVLAAVLAAGVGMFAMSRLIYQDAFLQTEVRGSASGFSSSSVSELVKSDLIGDLYYYGKMNVYVCDAGCFGSVTLSNDFEKYLKNQGKPCDITYAEGYDESAFDATGPVCLLGKALAEDLGVRPGQDIVLMTDSLYQFMKGLYKDAGELQSALMKAGKLYKVAGVLESGDAFADGEIYTAANDASEVLYGQPFPVGYCEFTLADNRKLDEVYELLDGQKKQGMQYAPTASYYMNVTALENTRRIWDLLESLFPVATAVSVLIGLLGSGLVMMQSAKEAAILRILGVTKRRARCMLALEQVILCAAGIALVAGGLYLGSPGLFARSSATLAACFALYFLGCACGACTAAVQTTRRKLLELLQEKE